MVPGFVEWMAENTARVVSVMDVLTYREVSGTELLDLYNDKRVQNCMTGKPAVSLFTQNPTTVSQLVVIGLSIRHSVLVLKQ